MSNFILTPYRLFFINQNDSLFALMKDGRILPVKKLNSFSNISADSKYLTGVRFDGENTHIIKTSTDFNTSCSEIMTSFGYNYYPSLNKDFTYLATIRADLLSPYPFGTLIIYRKLRKNWKEVLQKKAFMKRPIWSKLSNSIFFINDFNQLIKYNLEGNEDILAQNVIDFALSPAQSEITYWNGNTLKTVSILDKTEIFSFPISNLKMFSYSEDSNFLYFCTALENKEAFYSIDRKTNNKVLILETLESISFLFTS